MHTEAISRITSIPAIRCKSGGVSRNKRPPGYYYVPDRRDRDAPTSSPADPYPTTNQTPSPREPIFDRKHLL